MRCQRRIAQARIDLDGGARPFGALEDDVFHPLYIDLLFPYHVKYIGENSHRILVPNRE